MFGFFRDVLEWLSSPPRITRWLLVPTLVIPFLCRLGLVSPYSMVHDWSMLWIPHVQLWRLVTPLFCSPFGINLLFTCYFRYQCLSQLEVGTGYAQKPADLVAFLLFSTLMFNIAAIFIPIVIFEEALTMSLVYVWAQYFKDMIVTFLFGMRFPALYLPWVLLVMDLLYEKSLVASVTGLFVGHLYYFLYVLYPNGGRSMVSAPGWLQRAFAFRPVAAGPVHVLGRNNVSRDAEASSNTRSFSGAGYRLGSSTKKE